MRKKGTLYKVNKYNKDKALFMPEENLFSGTQSGTNQMQVGKVKLELPKGGFNFAGFKMPDVSQGLTGKALAGVQKYNQALAASNAFKLGAEKGASAGLSSGIGALPGMLAGGVGTMLGNAAGSAVAGDYELGGVGEVANVIQSVNTGNPIIDSVKNFAVGTLAGTAKRAFGTSIDEERQAAVNAGINQNENFVSNAGSFDAVKGPEAVVTDTDVAKGGWFGGGRKADRINRELRDRMIAARSFANRSVDNNILNLQNDQLSNELANYSAFGGPIDTIGMNDNMGAIGYGFMSDYLGTKRKQAESKNQMTNLFMGAPSSMFAFGGDMQTNSSDFPTGLTHIDAGSTHSENPNDGVQLGVDSEGTPNLVEEGETVFDDYVFSNRILADAATKSLFHLPKKKDITFADISEKLEKEIAERPNDPLSRAGFKSQMEKLQEQQERQKQEMEAERAKAAFEALSPEEQTALMQQKAMEEQAMMNQAAQEEAITQQVSDAQSGTQQAIVPPEAPMMQADDPQAELAQLQANVSALGGELVRASDVDPETNVFEAGGRKARRVAKKYNKEWFLNQAKSLGLIGKDANDLVGFKFDENDPTGNLASFNNVYRQYQRDKALDVYRKGQRQAKKNELFGNNGLYRLSDDGSKVYKARVAGDKDIWVNKDNEFIDQEAYDTLSEKDKEAFKRTYAKVGDRLYGYNGKVVEDLYDGDEDALLDKYASDYEKNFKWNDKDAQTLQYPVGMEHSALSNLRYVPALAGAIGLGYDLLTPADYSNAEAVERAGSMTPLFVHPNYNPTYIKPHVFDVWQQRNRNAANLNSAIRTFGNTANPNKNANILATLYNATNLDGQLGIDADKYNREDEFRRVAHNSGENKTLAQMDMQAQLANQNAFMDAQRMGFSGRLYGSRMRDDIDARKSASMSANLTNLMQSIGNIGEESYDEDRLKWLENTGTLRSKYYAACGGRLKKKNGGKLKLTL